MADESHYNEEPALGKIFVITPYSKEFRTFMRFEMNGQWDKDAREWVVEYSAKAREAILAKMKELFNYQINSPEEQQKIIAEEIEFHTVNAYNKARKLFPEMFITSLPSLSDIRNRVDEADEFSEELNELWDDLVDVEDYEAIRAEKELFVG